MTRVSTIRDLNNTYGPHELPNGTTKVLVCPHCCIRLSADLARYWCPRDAETFGCPHCDVPLWLRFECNVAADLPLAQRYPDASAVAL